MTQIEDQSIGTVEKFGYLLQREHPTDGVALSGTLEEQPDGSLAPEQGAPVDRPTRLYEKDELVWASFE